MLLPYKFGKYILEQKIAQGGMAEIYKAKYVGEGGFEKTVAVKRILPAWSDSKDFITMLCDEAKALVQLQHQNIVQVYELGRDGNTFYISMEYVDGIDVKRLFKIVQSGSKVAEWPLKFTCFIVSEVLKALDFSHNKNSGIIHRDISPQNVLVSLSGEVKVADFGIAKGFHRSFETTVQQVKGKYAYMSPEQAGGKAVDARTDLYSVGVIFYELLTGQRLHDAPNDLMTIEEVKRSSLPNGWGRELDTGLKDIIIKSIKKDISERYQTAREFLNDVNRYIVSRGLVTNCIELSGELRKYFEANVKHEAPAIENKREKTRALSDVSRTLPESKTWSLRYAVSISLIILSSLFFGFSPHSVNYMARSVQTIPEIEAKEDVPAPAPSPATLSVQARPWGYVYIPGLVERRETPVRSIKAKPGDYTLKVNFEPENRWVEKKISLAGGSKVACVADFSEGENIICRALK